MINQFHKVIARRRISGGAPVIVANDTFTDTDTTALTAHTSDSGDTWAQNGGGTMQIFSNRLESTQSVAAGLHYSSYVPGSADYSIKLTTTSAGSAIPTSVAGRCSTSALTMYSVRWDGTDTWTLHQWNAGSLTSLGTWVGDSPVGGTVVVELIMSGTTITAEFGGVERISATGAVTAAGRPGLCSYYNDVPASHTWYVDDWEVTE